MNFGDKHTRHAPAWHPSSGGEKGNRHAEGEQTSIEACKGQLPYLRHLAAEYLSRRWHMVFFAACHRLRFFWILSLVAAGSPNFTLRLAQIGPFEQVTPTSNDYASQLVKDLVYEPLLVPGDTGELTPRLVRTWELLSNGNLYIEPDTSRSFSDGSPVTLQDVADSLVAAGLRPSFRGSGLEITPGADHLRPEVALPRALIFKKTSNGLIGTGAFTIASQDRDQIVLQRVHPTAHRIDRVELAGYSTPKDVLSALARGDCNGALGVSAVAVELFLSFMSQFQVFAIPQMHRQAIVLNRHSLSPKDRERILATLQSTRLEAIIPHHFEPVSLIPPTLGPGQRLTVLTWNADWAHYRLALAVRRLLGLRGGEVLALSPPEAAATFYRGDFGIAIGAIQTWPEAEALSLWRTGGPFGATGYSNPALDAALDVGDWKAARRAFDLDPPGAFLLEWTTFAALDSRIFNPTLGRYRRLETLPEWEVP